HCTCGTSKAFRDRGASGKFISTLRFCSITTSDSILEITAINAVTTFVNYLVIVTNAETCLWRTALVATVAEHEGADDRGENDHDCDHQHHANHRTHARLCSNELFEFVLHICLLS